MRTDRRPFAFLPGLGGLMRGELRRWFGPRIVVHTAVWTLLVTGLLWLVTTRVADVD